MMYMTCSNIQLNNIVTKGLNKVNDVYNKLNYFMMSNDILGMYCWLC